MWFERNRDKDHGDMTQNPTCVKITRSIFMNKKTISFRIYQANRLEQRAKNQYVAGIIIIESSCSSTEESDYKSLSYDSKGNYVQQMRDRDTLIETVTLIKHSAAFIIYSVILHCKLFCREFSYKQVTL